ncbi:MAG: flagellar type III secretion system protein FliR [Firmicutes bacterium]|nr:flagellar type III secretion system protein FliR [Bacillota bacterium]
MSIVGFQLFFLISVRIGSFMVSSPIFSMKSMPKLLKIGFVFIFSFLLFNVIPLDEGIINNNMLSYFMLIIKETIFGLILGYLTNIIFVSLQMAGQMIDFQSGFAIASSFDPVTGNRISLYGKIYYWLGLILFFVIDGHHYLLYSLAKSFELVSLTKFDLGNLGADTIGKFFTESFVIAFQIAVPLIFILLLSTIVVGLLARTVPQINIFILGLPLKVLVGILTMLVLLPAIGNQMINLIETLPYKMDRILTLFGG